MLRSLLAYARGRRGRCPLADDRGQRRLLPVTKRIHNHLHGAPGDGGALGEAERAGLRADAGESAAELPALVRAGDVVFLHDPQTAGLVPPHRKPGAASSGAATSASTSRTSSPARPGRSCARYVEDGRRLRLFPRRPMSGRASTPTGSGSCRRRSTPSRRRTRSSLPRRSTRSSARVGLAEPSGGGGPVFTRQDGTPGRVDRARRADQDGAGARGRAAGRPGIALGPAQGPGGRDRVLRRARAATRRAPAARRPRVAGGRRRPRGGRGPGRGSRDQRDGAARRACARASTSRACRWTTSRRTPRWSTPSSGSADVVVQKSLAEGFGLTVAEAMWKARPVVASAVGGIQDQIVDGESGVLVDDPARTGRRRQAIDCSARRPQPAASDR